MLVINRTEGEQTIIEIDGRRLELTVLQVTGGRVKLGFDGPLEFSIRRDDIHNGKAGDDKLQT